MDKYIPVGVPRSTHYGNNYYGTYSIKLKRNVNLFSQLEYHNFLTLEMNPSIISFCEQPLKISIDFNGSIESSILDMWVQYRDGIEEFQEVKYKSEVEGIGKNALRTQNQILKQKLWCEQQGYIYRLRTETEIHSGPYLISNLRYLCGAIKRVDRKVVENYLNDISNIINKDKMTILDLTQSCNLSIHNLFLTLSYGIYNGTLEANLNTTIFSYDTYIWLKT